MHDVARFFAFRTYVLRSIVEAMPAALELLIMLQDEALSTTDEDGLFVFRNLVKAARLIRRKEEFRLFT